MRLDKIIDKIREKYGFTSIVHANSKLEGARAIAKVNWLVVTQAAWMEFRTKGLIKINIISQYEQGYISYSEFEQNFLTVYLNLKSAFLELVALSFM